MAEVFRGPIPPLELPEGNLVTYVFSEAFRWKDRPALICGDTLRTKTFAELELEIGRWGAWLKCREEFAPQRTVVAVLTGVSVEMAVIQLGTMAQGGIFCVIHNNYLPSEMAQQLQSSNTGLVVVSEKYEHLLREALAVLGRSLPVVIVGQATGDTIGCFDDIVADPELTPLQPAQLSGAETLFLVYTSGTSGLPKCVQISHNNVTSSLAQMVHPVWCSVLPTTDTYQHKTLQNRNFGLAYGFVCAFLPSLKMGVCQVVAQVTQDTMLTEIAKHKVNQLHIVPPTLVTLLRIGSECPAALRHFTSLFISGAPVAEVQEAALRRDMPSVMLQKCYGMSEVCVIAVDPASGGKPNYTGQLMPNVEAKVLDMATGKPLPAKTNGIIHVRSPSVMIGYLNNVEATKALIDSAGWVNTGDVGHVDEDGFIRIVEREKDIINGKLAILVSPAELENALLEHPLVKEACVMGILQPLTGVDDIVAFVAVSDTHSVTEQDVKDIIKKQFNENKHINKAVVNRILPKNINGKIDRQLLRTKAAELYEG